jgi:hypothetical protein
MASPCHLSIISELFCPPAVETLPEDGNKCDPPFRLAVARLYSMECNKVQYCSGTSSVGTDVIRAQQDTLAKSFSHKAHMVPENVYSVNYCWGNR